MDTPRPPLAWFHAFFTGAQQGLFVGTLSRTSAETLAANPFLKLILGHSPEEPDAACRPFTPDRFTDPRARDTLIDTLERDGAVREQLFRLRRADGSLFWAEVTGHAEPSPDGLAFFAIVRDVTERKRRDDQSRELYHQLLQAEKLAALGTTISGVAHELNNPLATILTSAERLARKPMEPELGRAFETILGEAERAAKIVRNLLTFARKRHTTRTMVDLNQVVRDTLALRVYEQRLANIGVIDALAAGLPAVFADPHQLQQVLLTPDDQRAEQA
jgi:PAS domain S-box-containing protein